MFHKICIETKYTDRKLVLFISNIFYNYSNIKVKLFFRKNNVLETFISNFNSNLFPIYFRIKDRFYAHFQILHLLDSLLKLIKIYIQRFHHIWIWCSMFKLEISEVYTVRLQYISSWRVFTLIIKIRHLHEFTWAKQN